MKSVTVYQIEESKQGDVEGIDFDQAFESLKFTPCGNLDLRRDGFIETPCGELATRLMGATHFVYQREDKILPASVIKDHVEEKIKVIFDQEGRRVSRKERGGIKDEIIFELLPRAFTRKSQVPCFIAGGKIFIGTSSANRAEEIISKVREALGSFPCLPIERVNLDELARNGEDGKIIAQEKIKLVQVKGEATSTNKHLPVDSAEITALMDSGMSVEEIGILYDDKFSATYTAGRVLKSFKLSDDIKDQASDGCETTAELWQNTQVLIAGALGDFYV